MINTNGDNTESQLHGGKNKMNDNKMWALVKETAAPGLALKEYRFRKLVQTM